MRLQSVPRLCHNWRRELCNCVLIHPRTEHVSACDTNVANVNQHPDGKCANVNVCQASLSKAWSEEKGAFQPVWNEKTTSRVQHNNKSLFSEWRVSRFVAFSSCASLWTTSVSREMSADVGWTFIRMTLYHIHTQTHAEYKSTSFTSTFLSVYYSGSKPGF